MLSFREFLEIELPIIQAPMAGVQGSELAIAVSNAGGLGSLPCATLTPEALHTQLAAITAAVRAATNRPFNVNFFCHTPPPPDPQREEAWRKILAPYYAEYGIDAASIPTGPGRAPFSHAIADLVEPFKPPVVSFHFGLPTPDLMERVKSWGSTILSSATTVDEALWLEAHGADGIIAQGLEAGGHRGMFLSDDLTTQLGLFALLPQIVRAVKLPVIAAGGVADVHGVEAAMALGAAAVQVGSAYLLCPEATTSAVHRAALQSPKSQHTSVTNLFSGRPARGIVNRIMAELGSLHPAVPAFPLATSALAPLRAEAERRGQDDFSPLWCGQEWCGQNASGCASVPAAQLTHALATGAL